MGEMYEVKYMQRCLELARNAEGMTYPNPLVGAVIVYDGKIVGEGFHQKAGEAHAEVNAINSVSDKSVLKSSTLYVNLEPCSHFGKTPPCTDLIISYSIPEVIIGTTDTSSNVSGSGIDKLISSGCKVVTGVLEKECRRVNRRFFTYIEKKRPYITLKWAQSADRYLDILRSESHITVPTWITGKPERVLVHRWRSFEQAILAGAGTVRADNPKLNVRDWSGNQPVRIILSRSGNISREAELIRSSGKLIVFTENIDADIPDSVKVKLNENLPAAAQIADYLYKMGVQSLLIEGGAEVLRHFISEGYWDEARVFTGLSYFRNGIKAPDIQQNGVEFSQYTRSSLEIFLNDDCSVMTKIDILNRNL